MGFSKIHMPKDLGSSSFLLPKLDTRNFTTGFLFDQACCLIAADEGQNAHQPWGPLKVVMEWVQGYTQTPATTTTKCSEGCGHAL